MIKTLRIMPGENEDKFMEIHKTFTHRKERAAVRIGAIWKTPWNEYNIDMDDYLEHKEELDAVSLPEEKKSIGKRIISFLSKPEILVPTLAGAASIGFAIFGAIKYGEGWDDAMQTVKTNSDPILHKAYDIGMDAMLDAIHENIPEAAKLISEHEEFDVKVGEASVDFVKGILKLK